MSDIRKLIFLSILSILFGGFIYVAFRSDSIVLFSWIDYIGFAEPIDNLRLKTLPYKDGVPDWVLYSLPDGLWLFSFSSAVMVIWEMEITRYSLILLLSILILVISLEALQYYNIINGTFDIIDVIFFIFGAVLPMWVFKKTKKLKK